LTVGEAAASALHASHYRPTVPVASFFGGTKPGEWRSPGPMAFLFLATTKPFALTRPSQFRPPPPPPMVSQRYRREYDEVKALGDSTAHPNATTDTALFWSVNFFAQWNEALRLIVESHPMSVGDSARAFALANMAMADAAIAVWESKRFYNFWRPSTAIQNGDSDGNARTVADITWKPLLADPPYPDYVSGANGVTAGFTGVLQLLFGDDFDFVVRTTHGDVADKEREYSSFSQAQQEVVEARILLGIHFRSADEEARRLGNRVARWTFQKFLRPVRGKR
jgi:hypothetical protein